MHTPREILLLKLSHPGSGREQLGRGILRSALAPLVNWEDGRRAVAGQPRLQKGKDDRPLCPSLAIQALP